MGHTKDRSSTRCQLAGGAYVISAERRVWAFSLGVAAILLFVFLWMYGQQQRTDEAIHSWKHFTYNDFIAGIAGAARNLGYQTVGKDPALAALQVGEAAMSLEQMSAYEDITTTGTTPEMRDQYSRQSPAHVEDVTHYLSYAAAIIANPNQAMQAGDVKSAESYVIAITKLLFAEASTNHSLSDIPDSIANKIFTQMYNMIPKSFHSQLESMMNGTFTMY